LSYIAVDENGKSLSDEVSIRIIFSRILVEIIHRDGTLFGSTHYVCNDAYASVSLKAIYSHNKAPVSGARVSFKPSNSLTFTDREGFASLKLVGRNIAYDGHIEVSDSIIDGNTAFRIVFTDVLLEPSKKIFYGMSGEEVEVTIFARLTFDGALLNGVRVKMIGENIVKETPASFQIKITNREHLKVGFEAIDFLPCVKPCEIILIPNAVKFGEPQDTSPTVMINGFTSKEYSYEFLQHNGPAKRYYS